MDDETRLALGKQEQVVIKRANVLLVGDWVNLFADQPGAAYGWGTVVCVTEDEVEVVRPYVHTSDFSMGRGDALGRPRQREGLDEWGRWRESRLVPYVGQEVIRLPRRSDRTYTIVFRTTVPEIEEQAK